MEAHEKISFTSICFPFFSVFQLLLLLAYRHTDGMMLLSPHVYLKRGQSANTWSFRTNEADPSTSLFNYRLQTVFWDAALDNLPKWNEIVSTATLRRLLIDFD